MKSYFFCILLCVGLGFLSGRISHAGETTWYTQLHKPEIAPPGWLVAPIWIVLYTFMGIVFATLWRGGKRERWLLLLFCAQFIANLLWSPLFFLLHRIDWALYDLGLLWLLLFLFTLAVRKRWSLLLLTLPYLGWVSFALYLNATFYRMNLPYATF